VCGGVDSIQLVQDVVDGIEPSGFINAEDNRFSTRTLRLQIVVIVIIIIVT